jgi:hypothetical protein
MRALALPLECAVAAGPPSAGGHALAQEAAAGRRR